MHQTINSHLIEWSHYDKDCKTDLFSHAYISEGKVLIIDPIRPDDATLKAIQALGQPCAILLTNGNHERFSRVMGDLLKIPIAAPAFAIRELSYKPDIIVDNLKQIHGLVPVPLPGGGPGEFAYYCPANHGLFIGDALINLKKTGLTLLPDAYCENPIQLRNSLLSILKLKLNWVSFAHGDTLAQPIPALKKLLQT
jgi:glyoxylase-like metal-dependent hydrolase (beta-lactamase superfamily II)